MEYYEHTTAEFYCLPKDIPEEQYVLTTYYPLLLLQDKV